MARLPRMATQTNESVVDVLQDNNELLSDVRESIVSVADGFRSLIRSTSATNDLLRQQIEGSRLAQERAEFAAEEARREARTQTAQATSVSGDGGDQGGGLGGLLGGLGLGAALSGGALLRLLPAAFLGTIAPYVGDLVQNLVTGALTDLTNDPNFAASWGEALGAGAFYGTIGTALGLVFGKRLGLLFAVGGALYNKLDQVFGLDQVITDMAAGFGVDLPEGWATGIGTAIGIAVIGALPMLLRRGLPRLLAGSAAAIGLGIGAAGDSAGGRASARASQLETPRQYRQAIEEARFRPGTYQRAGVAFNESLGRFVSGGPTSTSIISNQEAFERLAKARIGARFPRLGRVLGPLIGAGITAATIYFILEDESLSDEAKANAIGMELTAIVGGVAVGALIGGLASFYTGPGAIFVAGLGAIGGYFAGDYIARKFFLWAMEVESEQDITSEINQVTGGAYAGYENMTQEDILRQYAPEALPQTPMSSGPRTRGGRRDAATSDTTNVRTSTSNATALPTVDVAGQFTARLNPARDAAEKYLGRPMSDEEYDYLLRAVYAESSAATGGDYTVEKAMIMASILNRARSGYADDPRGSVIGALTARNQFHSVTGTANDPGPSPMFNQGPSGGSLVDIELAAMNILNSVSRTQRDFTAAATGAYGSGTNIGYRDEMLAGGGVTVGGTVFRGGRPGQTEADAALAALVPPSNQVSGQVNENGVSAESIGVALQSAINGNGGGNTIVNNDNSTTIGGGNGGNGNQQTGTIPSALDVSRLLQEAFGLGVVNNAG